MPYCRNCGYTAGTGETDCRICGQNLVPSPPDTAAAEPTAPVLHALPTPGSPAPKASALRRLITYGAPAAVLFFVGAAAAFHWLLTKPKLEQIVPRDAACVFVVDGRWWWDATKDIRAQPDVRDQIQQFEKDSKLSLETDIAPWVGQVGLAGWGVGDRDGAGAAYLEVHDWVAFSRFLAVLQRQASDASRARWLVSSYHGVRVQTLTADATPGDSILALTVPKPSISIAMIKGWVVVGIGERAIEKSIDTFQGREPSVADDPTWVKALARRPEHWFAWVGMGSKGLASVFRPAASLVQTIPGLNVNVNNNPNAFGSPFGVLAARGDGINNAAPKQTDIDTAIKQLSDFNVVLIGCVSDRGDGFRFDSYAVAGSDQAKQIWRDLKGTSGGVSGDILRQLPKDTDVAFLAHDPAGWWARYKKAVLAQSTADNRSKFEELLTSVGPLERAIYDYPGDCGLALTYHEAKGFGAVLLAQGKNPAAVTQSAHLLGDYIGKQNVDVRWDGGMAEFPGLGAEASTEYLPLNPTFGDRDDYFAAATSPIWLDASTERGASFAIPDEARGADFIALGDFRMMPSLLRDLAKSSGSDKTATTGLRDTGLEGAHWSGFVRTEPDGSFQQSTWEIRGWNWREAIRRELKDVPKASSAPRLD